MAKRQAVLSLIVDAWGGMHAGGWRDPDAPGDVSMDFERVKEMVLKAERAKFHTFFLADSLGYAMEKEPEVLALTSNAVKYEPFTLCAALAMITKNIGLSMTASTTYSEPFNVARMFASLDHLSGGRAGFNVVASTGEAAVNFNDIKVEHETRYERAAEYLEVVTSLWDSWDDDAFIRNKTSGQYFDANKLHVPNHRGEYFQVEGPLNVSRPPQGHPVIAQAGASPAGLAFAAKVADLVFTYDVGLEKGQEFYAQARDLVASNGRNPDHVKILPSLLAVVGNTQAEADEKFARLNELADPRIGIERLRGLIDFDLGPYPLDGPVPVDDIAATEHWSKSMQDYYVGRARDENLTVRELALIAMQFDAMSLSADALVDHIVERVEKDAADGFNICLADASGSLDVIVDKVVPELQRRGYFQTEYQGKTLRENLGIPKPQNRFAATGAPA